MYTGAEIWTNEGTGFDGERANVWSQFLPGWKEIRDAAKARGLSSPVHGFRELTLREVTGLTKER